MKFEKVLRILLIGSIIGIVIYGYFSLDSMAKKDNVVFEQEIQLTKGKIYEFNYKVTNDRPVTAYLPWIGLIKYRDISLKNMSDKERKSKNLKFKAKIEVFLNGKKILSKFHSGNYEYFGWKGYCFSFVSQGLYLYKGSSVKKGNYKIILEILDSNLDTMYYESIFSVANLSIE